MVLLPWVDYGNQKVRLLFDGCWLEPREFTVNVKPHERRAAKQQSHYYLRSLQEVAKDINDTLVEVKDLTNAFAQLKLNPENYELLMPLVNQVVDAAQTLKEDNDVEYSHRLHEFQVFMRQVSSKLLDPEILTNLKDEKQDKYFWATVDLKALVQWKIMQKTMSE